MRSYERSTIVVDQCTECRGVFLDRGELEKLIDAESREVAAAAPAWGTSQPRPEKRDDDDRYRYRDDDDRNRYRDDYRDDYRGEYGYGDPRYRRKKKKSFLEDLFD
jgi:Zn-finger nucleic acid-binding protein